MLAELSGGIRGGRVLCRTCMRWCMCVCERCGLFRIIIIIIIIIIFYRKLHAVYITIDGCHYE